MICIFHHPESFPWPNKPYTDTGSLPLWPVGSHPALAHFAPATGLWAVSWMCSLCFCLENFLPKCIMAAVSSLSRLCSERPSGPCLSFALFYFSLWQLCLADVSVSVCSLGSSRPEGSLVSWGLVVFIVVCLEPGKWVACRGYSLIGTEGKKWVSPSLTLRGGRHCLLPVLPWAPP